MIKAVIFDLNGVLIQNPKLSNRFQDKFGVSSEEFLPALREIMAKVRKPDAGDAFTYWKPYFEKWGLGLTREDFFDFWFNAEKEAPELIESAKRIKKKGVKIFILSNNFRERAAYYEENFPFLNIFDRVYYSWQTGFAKPNPEAFKNLLLENDLKPEECIYFDDLKENIEVADSLGITSFLFEGLGGFERILKDYQLI